MKNLHFILITAAVLLACRREKLVEPPATDPCFPENCSYLTYSTDNFEREYKHLLSHANAGPFYAYKDPYLYSDPVFNPCNPYEIAYMRADTNAWACEKELWKFSFCTGKAVKLAEQVCYTPHWSSTGWIIYTSDDGQLWKIKSNGDSLTQLTNDPGLNNHAKWSPDGSMYAYFIDMTGYLSDKDGNKIKTIPYRPINWIDDESILFVNSTGIMSYNIHTEDINKMHSAKLLSAGRSPLDKKKLFLYHTYFAGFQRAQDDMWVRYSLQNGASDSIRTLYDSYLYVAGDYSEHTDKTVIILARSSWKDSLVNLRYGRTHILLMNPDGTEERLVKLPE